MINVVLYQPEIPPNTGNIMRLCANTGARLHLIHPLGFDLDEKALRRAGLDYRDWAHVEEHAELAACLRGLGVAVPPAPAPLNAASSGPALYAFSTRNAIPHTDVSYREHDVLLFGPETRGLPEELLERLPAGWRVRIPMRPESRSLNLSNAVAVGVFEAWRQLGFAGAR